MIQNFPFNFPPQNTPYVDQQGTATIPGMAFFRALWNRTGQGTGLDSNTAIVTAAGSSATDATPLTSDWNHITAGTGGVLLASLTGGQMQMVQNSSGSGITVYAPSGASVDGGASYSLANTKMQLFWFFDQATVISTQLG